MLIAEADLPWAVAYLHDEYTYAGVPDAIESSESPTPEPVMGLDFISKKSTWVYTWKDRDDEVRVREWVVPRRKRHPERGGLVTLESDEYEQEKDIVKALAVKWMERRLDREDLHTETSARDAGDS